MKILIVSGFYLLLLSGMPVWGQSSIRSVNFKNFTYKLRCGDDPKTSSVRAKKGSFSSEISGNESYLSIAGVRYGDLNGDGREEAAVTFSCGSGASYVYFGGLVFQIQNRKPALLAEIEGGNKGMGGIVDVQIRNRFLVVKRYRLGSAGSPCCPDSIETTKYRVYRKRLNKQGRSRSSEIREVSGK
jgi:hypothetical protein